MEPNKPLVCPESGRHKNNRGKDKKLSGIRDSRFGYPVMMIGQTVALHGDRTPIDWGRKCKKAGAMNLAAYILAHYGIVSKSNPDLALVAAFADLQIVRFHPEKWKYSRHQANEWVAAYRAKKLKSP